MKRPAILLAVALLFLSLALISYRIISLKYPVFPTAPGKAWQLDMEAHIKADQKEISVMIGLPYSHAGQIVVEEKISSGEFNFNLLREGPNQIGIWSGDVGPGEEMIRYRATIHMVHRRSSKAKPPKVEPYSASVGKTEQALAERLVKKWSQLPLPTRFRAVAATVAGNWGEPPPNDQDLRAWSAFQKKHGRLEALLVLLRAGDIAGLQKALNGRREFVIKPARGAGGSGIILITDHQPVGFIKQNGEILSSIDLAYHISGMISGIYSLEGLEDRALIEALIHPDPIFAAVTYFGVPDIRIVVYRGVPVMGMVRLPTRDSDGKANLHRGAIGVGIDIRNGTTLTAVHRSGVITHHPDTGNPVSGIQVPYWKRMLQIGAKAFDMTGLGYLGVDMVIDSQRGPLLLELNARPGLQIQIANRGGLHGRLELIDKAPPDIFATIETRVAWALETFTSSS